MDPVNNLGRLTEILRRQALENTAKAGKRDAHQVTNNTAGTEKSDQHKNVAQLEGSIRERIKGLAADHPKRKQLAAQIFVESVLAWEFGETIRDDPRFPGMVAAVREALESESLTNNSIARLIDAGNP